MSTGRNYESLRALAEAPEEPGNEAIGGEPPVNEPLVEPPDTPPGEEAIGDRSGEHVDAVDANPNPVPIRRASLVTEPLKTWQFRMTAPVHERLVKLRFELRMRDLEAISDAQFVVGAVIAGFVDTRSKKAQKQLVEMLAAFGRDRASVHDSSQRFSGQLPASIVRSVYESAEHLKSERAGGMSPLDRSVRISQQAVAQALIWQLVRPEDPKALDWLVERVLIPYLEALYPARAEALGIGSNDA